MRKLVLTTVLVVLVAVAAMALSSKSDKIATAETSVSVTGYSLAVLTADGGTAVAYFTGWRDTIFTSGGDTLPRSPSRDTVVVKYLRELLPRDFAWANLDSIDTMTIVPTGADTVVYNLF